MYEQSLVKTVEPIKKTTISRMNKGKKWKYGYNKEQDLIVLSHDGQIGEIIEIQNLVIALPKMPKDVYKDPKNKWVKFTQPKELERLKNIFDWRSYPESSKEKWHDYINEEFRRREEGFWFMNCFLYSGKLVRQIKDVTVCAILKIEDLDFLLCHQQKPLT